MEIYKALNRTSLLLATHLQVTTCTELLCKAITLQLKMFTFFMMFAFLLLNSIIPNDLSRTTSFRK